MYAENENPVFAPWTANGGGGPPFLWEFEGHLYSHRWLEPNVAFLRGVLSVSGVSGALTRAVERLSDQPDALRQKLLEIHSSIEKTGLCRALLLSLAVER